MIDSYARSKLHLSISIDFSESPIFANSKIKINKNDREKLTIAHGGGVSGNKYARREIRGDEKLLSG